MKLENELDENLQETMRRWDVPGLAAAIVHDGQVVYARWFGVQSLATGAPLTPASFFGLQSVSKCFVATAAMQLVERGLLHLDAPLVESLPWFRLADERYRQISLRQVLSHTSGMPDMEESEYVEFVAASEADDGAAERYVRSLDSLGMIDEPGARFHYSNIAYNVLGVLLAHAAGTSFEALLREQSLRPVGMTDSTFLLAEIPPERLAMPHLRSPGMQVSPVYPYHRPDAPASFLHATLPDVCNWAIACLGRGRIPGSSLLSAASYDTMWTPVARRADPPSLFEQMGLGWSLGHYHGEPTVCHGGAGFGGTSFLLLMPGRDSAAIVLCNEESGAHQHFIQALAGAILGEAPRRRLVSCRVALARALAQGGMEAMRVRYDALKTDTSEGYHLDAEELYSLALELMTARKESLAADVLRFHLELNPEALDSHVFLARLLLRSSEIPAAREHLHKALTIDPGNQAAQRMLAGSAETG